MALTLLLSPASYLIDICFFNKLLLHGVAFAICQSISCSCCSQRLLLFMLTRRIFHCSRYASCLEYLENLKPNLLLDIHLHDHVEALYTQIRHKAIIQYTHPFISVDLLMMAGAFKTHVSGLEKELEVLITDNQIQAGIDSHNKILYARHADQRNTTFQRVLQTGVEFERDVRAMLLRANLIKHEYNERAAARKV